MNRFELVIVGGGLTAARAIKSYREAGGEGRIALLAKERSLPYHRPPLSKRFLRGEAERQDTLVEPESFYAANEVELVLGTEVARVEPGEQAVETSDGSRYRYRKLLLATGAEPRRLPVEGADLQGVFTLRTVDDSAAIREAAAKARDAVVVGSGFIGMEVAASLTDLGLEVVLISRDTHLHAQLRSPEISEHLADLYRRRRVAIVVADQVRAFHGRSSLDTVELQSGRALGAGLAVVGIGVQPALRFLEGSGIALDDGVLVDERFETNAPGVYAAGDVTRFLDPLYGRRRRISSTGRTPTTRAARSGRCWPERRAGTTPSPPSSRSRSG
jgi:NAD(P)H-nitrite reductase large subunit